MAHAHMQVNTHARILNRRCSRSSSSGSGSSSSITSSSRCDGDGGGGSKEEHLHMGSHGHAPGGGGGMPRNEWMPGNSGGEALVRPAPHAHSHAHIAVKREQTMSPGPGSHHLSRGLMRCGSPPGLTPINSRTKTKGSTIPSAAAAAVLPGMKWSSSSSSAAPTAQTTTGMSGGAAPSLSSAASSFTDYSSIHTYDPHLIRTTDRLITSGSSGSQTAGAVHRDSQGKKRCRSRKTTSGKNTKTTSSVINTNLPEGVDAVNDFLNMYAQSTFNMREHVRDEFPLKTEKSQVEGKQKRKRRGKSTSSSSTSSPPPRPSSSFCPAEMVPSHNILQAQSSGPIPGFFYPLAALPAGRAPGFLAHASPPPPPAASHALKLPSEPPGSCSRVPTTIPFSNRSASGVPKKNVDNMNADTYFSGPNIYK